MGFFLLRERKRGERKEENTKQLYVLYEYVCISIIELIVLIERMNP